MPSGRNPFPFPALQNDDNFVGQRSKMKTSFPIETSEAQQQQPWKRLYNKPTLASKRQEIYHNDPRAPTDSLDFVIKSQYDHHNQFLSGCNDTLVQKETTTTDHGRVLKNRVKEVPLAYDPMEPPLRSTASTNKGDPNNVDGAIQSHHSAATNGGYSRRHDGGFYSI